MKQETITENKLLQKLEVGQIFETSWGYDQTNYDFIIIVEVSPSGKTCKCKRCQYETVSHGLQTNEQKPIPQPYGKTFRMKRDYWNDKIQLRGSYIFCGGEDSDSKRFDSFSQVTEGQTFHETDPQFGH